MCIYVHVFAERWRSIGIFSESAFESIHGEFNQFDKTNACIDDDLKQLEMSFKLCSLKHDVRIAPHIKKARMCRDCQMPIAKAAVNRCVCRARTRQRHESHDDNDDDDDDDDNDINPISFLYMYHPFE